MTTPGDQPEPRLRLFVAIELPDGWKQAFATLQHDMQAALDEEPDLSRVRLRWVRPEGIHLTLKFLGEVPQSRLDSILTALDSSVPRPPAFDLVLGGIGSFNDRRAPRVIWAGIWEPADGASPHLRALFEQIETWLAAAGFPRERQSYTPHLTLARLPDKLDASLRERVAVLTGRFSLPTARPFPVEQVSLMRSFLGPSGARYERLAAYPAGFTGQQPRGMIDQHQ